MFLVVGLGNPGPKYARTRHNAGAMAVECIADRLAITSFREQFSGIFAQAKLGEVPVGLLNPLTYMNRSGHSVSAALRFFKIPMKQLLVLHDELDLPFGTNRVKNGGGLAGHNGLASIAEQCGGTDFLRVRIGIGRPSVAGEVTEYVLGQFGSEEKKQLKEVMSHVASAVELIVAEGIEVAMNQINRKQK